jgi:hypothetical protein
LTPAELGAIVRGMRATDEAAEFNRRFLLAQSDVLLEDVELLRLNDATETPARLREAIRALQIRLGRRNPPVPPATLDAAHELVYAVQQRLMAANPNSPRPTRPSGRPSGQPVMTVVREDRKWKVLTLPAPSGIYDDDEWWELVESTVERAWDRWCYAQQHAIRAARMHVKAQVALAVAQTAWTNYWLLLLDAERIRERINAARGRLAARTFAAHRP